MHKQVNSYVEPAGTNGFVNPFSESQVVVQYFGFTPVIKVPFGQIHLEPVESATDWFGQVETQTSIG